LYRKDSKALGTMVVQLSSRSILLETAQHLTVIVRWSQRTTSNAKVLFCNFLQVVVKFVFSVLATSAGSENVVLWCWRRLLGVSWREHRTNESVYNEEGTKRRR